MSLRIRPFGTLLCVLVVGGCNALLNNEDVTLADFTDGGTPIVQSPVDADGSTHPFSDDASAIPVESGIEEQDDASDGTCGAGEKKCDDVCVSRTEPAFGCGGKECAPCSLSRAKAACAGGSCAIESCHAGYADCDGKPENGCETDLSMPQHCGTCNSVCAPAAPLCAPSGGTFTCTTGCTAEAPTLCGNQCVDVTNSATHCGSCTNVCPAVPNGESKCAQSTCTFTCGKGFHACGANCASDTSPLTCGSLCAPCPAPINGVATCAGGTCGFTCNKGFHKCGAQCVSDSDPATCGGSCTPCAIVGNAISTCDGKKCGFECSAGYHACGILCASNDAVATCGTSCSPCPVPANATSTCSEGACGFACKSGFGNCDTNNANGCESTFATDPLNCGACGQSCNGSACRNGVCDPIQDSGVGDAN